MALKPLNSAGGFSVGENKANVILANGDITTGNANLTGNITASNANLGNLVTANYISATLASSASAQPNITSVGNLSSLTVTGNVNAGNLTATGTVSGNAANFSGNVVMGAVVTSVFYSASGQLYTPATVSGSNQQVFFNDDGSTGADSGLYYDKLDQGLRVGGNVTANWLLANVGANLGGVANVKMSGGTSGQYLQTDGAGNLSFSSIDTSKISNGASNVDISTANGNITVGVNGTGNVVVVRSTGANVTGTLGVSGTVTAGNLSVSGTSNLGAVANVAITGGSNGQYLRTDGQGNLSFATIDTAKIANGTSNVQIATANGNVETFVNGVRRFAVTSSGANINGNLIVGNVNTGLVDATTVQSAGQLVARTQIISQQDDGTPPFIVTSTTPVANLTVASAGNATVAQTVSNAAQPNITSVGNLTNLTSNGNVNFTGAGNVSLGALANVKITGGSNGQAIITDGTGNLSFVDIASSSIANIANGTSNVNIPAANGAVSVGVDGSANVLVITDEVSAAYPGSEGIITGNISATTRVLVANVVAPANANLTFTVDAGVMTFDEATGDLNIPGSFLTAANVTANNISANSVINANSGINTANFSANGANVSLGAVGNLHITGGSNGQVLSTDGSGNLSFISVATTNIANGNSNVSIPTANGNVNVSAEGNANVVVVTGGGLSVTGTISGTGNVSGGNLTTAGAVSAGTLSVTGTSNLNAVGNVTITGGSNGQFLRTAGNGVLSFAEPQRIVSESNANIFVTIDPVSMDGNITAQVNPNTRILMLGDGNLITVDADLTMFQGPVSIEQGLQSPLSTPLTIRTLVAVGNNWAYANLENPSGNLALSLGSFTTPAGVVANTVTANIAVNTANFSANGANVSLGAVGNLHITGGTNGQFLQTDGSGNLSFATLSSSSISNGNSNVSIPTANGNVTVSAEGNPNVVVISGVGANVSGTLGVSGTVTAGNLSTGGTLSVTSDANVGNLGTGGFITATGNVSGGNLTTAGAVSATGNVSGGNVTTAGAVSAGTLSVTGTSDLGAVGNVKITGGTSGQFLQTDGSGNLSFATLSSSSISNGNSNVSISTANGNVTVSAVGNTVLTVTGTGANVGGTLNVTGDTTLAGLMAANLTGSGGNLTISAAVGNNSVILTPTGTGTVDVSSKRITGVAEPTQSTDAATKAYVDAIAEGLHVHQSVAAATPDTLANITSGTITYNNGTNGVGATLTTTGTFSSIDGVSINSANTRILVKNEANAAHNGIYVYSNSTVITRAADFDTPTEMAGGDFLFVTGGTLYNSTGWVMTDAVTTVGTSPVPFAQFSGAGTYTAGSGLTLTGTAFSVNTDGITTEISAGNVVVKANAQFTTPNIGAATGTSLAATGNVSGGNLTTGGVVSATGNVSGGNLTTSGAVSGGTLSVTGTSNLGAVGNVTITGGTSGQFLQTNGSGGLSFATIVTSGVSNGTSNVSIATANGNVTMSVNGTSNVVSVSSTGMNVAGYANITGIVSAAPGNVRLSGGLLSQTVYVDSNGGLEFDYVRGNGNIEEIPFQTVGKRLIGSANFRWFDQSYGGGNSALLIGHGTNAAGNLFLGNGTANFHNANITFTGSNSGNITGVRDFSANTVSASNLLATYSEIGRIYQRGTILADGEVNIQMGVAGANFTPNLTISSNVNSNTVSFVRTHNNGVAIFGNAISLTGAVRATGNVNAAGYTVTADSFVGNISGILANGNSNVSLPTANGNINLSVAGNANVLVVTGTGVNVAGTLNATGNANVANLGTAGSITATGNVSAGNLSTGGILSVTGNANVGNIGAASGVFTANVSAANFVGVLANGNSNVRIATANDNVTISAVGNTTLTITGTGANITGTSNVSGNASAGNYTTAGAITATGNITGGNLMGPLANGNSNVSIAAANGNVTVTAVGNTTLTVTGTGANVTGTGNFSGNVSAANFVGTLANGNSNVNMASNGNITVVASGSNAIIVSNTSSNVTGNLLVTSGTAATSTTTGALIVTGGAGVSGNLYAGNIFSAGNMTFGNLTVNSNTTTSNLEVTGTATIATATIGNLTGNTTNVTINSNGYISTFDSTGNVTLPNNVIITETVFANAANLTSNVTVGNVLTVTGVSNFTGNATFGNFSGVFANGNSNISIPAANGNVTISAAGNANVVVVTGTGANIAGTANITGNAVVGGALTVTGNINGANISVANFSGSNISGTGTLSITGNANVGNLGTTGLITATGNITGGNLMGPLANGNSNVRIAAANGNVTVTAVGNTVLTITGTGANVSGTANITGNTVIGGTLNVTGNTTLSNASISNATVTGNLTAGNLIGSLANGNSNVRIATANGNVTVAAAGNTVLTVTGTGANVSGTANVTGNAFIGGDLDVNGAIFSDVSNTGRNYKIGDDSWVGDINVDGTFMITGNDQANRGYILFGNAFRPTGILGDYNPGGEGSLGRTGTGPLTSNGAFTVIGNLTAGNVIGPLANGTSSVEIATANGNVVTTVNNTARLTVAANTVNMNANANVTGNLVVSGTIRSSRNNTGQNFLVGDDAWIGDINLDGSFQVSGSSQSNRGYIYFGDTYNDSTIGGIGSLGRVANGALTSNGAFTVIGNLTANNFLGPLANGNSNVRIAAANGNVTITAVGNTTLTVTGTGANIDGTLNASGNANVGNLGTAGLITATGNVSGGNLTTGGALSVTGNANVGNIGATAGVFTGNVSAANFVGVLANGNSNVRIAAANGNVTITAVGNTTMTVTGTGANVSGTANITGNTAVGGALSVSGNATVTANVITDSVLSRTDANITITAGATNRSVVLAPTGTGTVEVSSKRITGVAEPTASTDAATKAYVDSVAQGLHVHASVNAATTGTLATLSGGTVTYNNGSAGVGATLTLSVALTTIDGVTLSNGMRVLVKNEANTAHNGIYDRTSSTVFTRSSDFDTGAEIAGGDFLFCTAGTLYNSTGWVQTDEVTTVGTDPIVFEQFSGGGTYTAGTGLTLTGTQFSISNTAVSAASYGNGDRVATFTVNAQGQLTAASNVAITANAANLTGTTLASTIVTSSLTTVGTLGSLTVSGNANVGNLGTAGLITATGNITGGNLTTGGVISATGNVSGGNLTTGGVVTATGNVSGGNLTTGGVVTATGNVSGGNLTTTGTLSVTGNANVGNLGTNGSIAATGNVSGGNVSATGNVSGGNLTTAGVVSATGNVSGGNLTTAGVVSATGNVSGGNITTVGVVSATGNVSGGNLTTAGVVSATGDVRTAAQLVSTVANGTAPLSVLSFTEVANLKAQYANVADTATTAGTVSTASQPNITSVGTLSSLTVTGNVSGGNLTTAGVVEATGNVSGGNINTAGVVSATGNVSGGNLTTAGVVSATGNVSGGNLTTAGTLSVTGNANVGNVGAASGVFTANISVGGTANVANFNANGTVSLGTVENVKINGGTNGQFLQTDGTGNLSWKSLSATSITNGNSNVEIAPNGNVTISSAGTANVLIVTSTGANVTGTFNATGNLVAGNVGATTVIATGNVEGSRLVSTVADGTAPLVVTSTTTVANLRAATAVEANTAGTVTTAAQPNITSVGTLSSLTVSGNVSAGNISTTGVANIANIQGGNITVTGAVVTSQLTANGAVDLGTVANIKVGGGSAGQYLQTDGAGNLSFVTLSSSSISNGTSNVSIPTANGNITFSVDGSSNRVQISNTEFHVNSLMTGNFAGNLISANLNTGLVAATAVDATGNIVAANLKANGLLQTANANITGTLTLATLAMTGVANLGAIANVVITGGTAGQFLKTDGAGNLSFDTISTSSISNGNSNIVVAANGNITFGAIGTANVVIVSNTGANVSGAFDASGNLSAGNISTGGIITAIGNITSNANVITDGVLGRTGNVTITAAAGNHSVRLVATGTGTVDVGSVRITSLATPSNDTDAATKAYVDSVAQGLDVKASVKAATTANITLSGTQTIDNVTLIVGDRVLVKNQETASENGIYVVASSSWTRSADMDAGSDFPGAFTFVEGGTINGDTGWVCTNDSVTLGTTNVTFTQFSGAGTYTAGTGLSLVGSAFSIANTTVTANTYGSNTKAVTFTVNAQGQLTAASESDITANANLLTGTTLASSVVTSSLTSVGTLTSLAVTGEITSNANITGANLTTGGVVSATGNVTGGNLIANTTLTVGSTSVRSGTLTTTSVTANQVVATFSTAGVTGVEFLVKGVDSTGSKYSIATVQAVTDGANVDYTIYGEVNIGTTTGTLAVNIDSGNIRLLVTPSSSNSTVWTTQIRVI